MEKCSDVGSKFKEVSAVSANHEALARRKRGSVLRSKYAPPSIPVIFSRSVGACNKLMMNDG